MSTPINSTIPVTKPGMSDPALLPLADVTKYTGRLAVFGQWTNLSATIMAIPRGGGAAVPLDNFTGGQAITWNTPSPLIADPNIDGSQYQAIVVDAASLDAGTAYFNFTLDPVS